MHKAPARSGSRGGRFLDPAVLARLDNLELVARTVVDGFLSGQHRSAQLGVSIDFAEHRPYQPGDDIRRIDWKLYARSDRYYVKEFEADSNTDLLLLVDVSRSMDWAGAGQVSKLDYARLLAACLAYLGHRQRDRVGLVAFDAALVDLVPPSARHYSAVLHALERLRAGGAGGLAAPLARAAELSRRRGIAVLVSDLYEPADAVLEAVRGLGRRSADLVVFHVLDPAELELPFDEEAPFEDLESGERLPIVPNAIQALYRERVARHVAELRQRLGEARFDYVLLKTSEPLDRALLAYLARRRRFDRVR
jgi:uncharacterized protein (DUF58 family)